jgi:predicted lipoprotein with Yx(FWY)xxD motif
MKFLAIATLTAALLGGCASMTPSAPVAVQAGILTGNNGMTLYTFDKDSTGSGKSVCNGQCAINWPPLLASDTDKSQGDYSIITRDDGKKQWARQGKPLYFWIKDSKPGDVTGNGVQNVWHTITP